MGPFRFPWEDMAREGKPLPEGLPLHDQAAYTAMRNIWASYRRGTITKECAAAEKGKVRRAYDMAAEEWAFQERMVQAQAKRFRATEAAAIACRLDPTAENAVHLCNVLDGLEVSVDG